MKKEDAARQAATKYSTDRKLATIEYANLTGHLDEDLTEVKKKSLQDEMLAFLPSYRYPTFNEMSELMIFVGLDIKGQDAYAITTPSCIEKLKNTGIENDLLIEIQNYVKKLEIRSKDFEVCRKELNQLREKFIEAQTTYEENRAKRPDQRNVLVVQVLGFSTGAPTPRIDKKAVMLDYMQLVRHKGMEPKDAVTDIQNKYDIQSYDAALKLLLEYRKALLEKLKTEMPDSLDLVKKYHKGYIPGRR